MLKAKSLKRILLCCVFAILCALIGIAATSAYAYTPGSYSDPYLIEITNFNAVYDIKSNRTMHVTEEITVTYLGYRNTGLQRSIPVNAGDRVRNVDVKIKTANGLKSYPYDTELVSAEDTFYFEDNTALVLSITDGDIKKRESSQIFHIEYDYVMTKAGDKNAMFLVVFGEDIPYEVGRADITLNLPDGYKSAELYLGKNADPEVGGFTYNSATNSIHTVITEGIGKNRRAKIDLYFEDGALSLPFEFTPYIPVLIGVALLAAVIILKLLKFYGDPVMPIVNFTPPEDMDPLMMGKYIDNKISSTDVTSLIYYWADKGYIKIDFSDDKNPAFIKIFNSLPESAPSYQRTMYDKMFASGDMVKVNELENKFYTTVEAVKKDVNGKVKDLYNSTSVGISIVFAVIGALLMVLTPIILALTTIAHNLFILQSAIMLVPAFLAYGFTEAVKYHSVKISKTKQAVFIAVIAIMCAVATLFYAFIISDAVVEMLPKILLCIVGFAIVMTSVLLVNRNKAYTDKLNGIVGFRNFILYAEKERLELLLKDDPQLYYHILPYAQVLGVTTIWEEKFKDITVEPPTWMADPLGTYFQFAVLNNLLRRTSVNMVQKMTSRPSSSGMSGGGGGRFGGGGFGGGGFGGGHGGGGMRGI